MNLRIVIALLSIFLLALPVVALASPFDGWTLEEIRADPGFVPIKETWGLKLSEATLSGDSDAPLCHMWIGYIDIDGDWRIYFDHRGDGLTCCFQDDASPWLDDMAPIWTRGLVSRLVEEGILEGYP
ncbi:hypothetical protein IT575_06545 [bacterium]|nr:hypothetical protein [bacterium]